MSERTTLGVTVRTSFMMIVFALAFTGLMAGVYQLTKASIDKSTEEEKMKLIDEVLPRALYDNELLKDQLDIGTPAELGLSDAGHAYRARKAGQPVAVILEAVAPDGYSGNIGLLIAIGADGKVAAVRVTEHKETPGLGDYIDLKKDKNKTKPWITQFNGQGFDQIPQAEWKVKKDGGRFEAHTGATISARAVTGAVGRALAYFNANKDKLFAAPAQAAK